MVGAEAVIHTDDDSKGSNVVRPNPFPNMVMSDEEDAYEEARSLAEEDHLAGTRSHEGDRYDPEDAYDDGYE